MPGRESNMGTAWGAGGAPPTELCHALTALIEINNNIYKEIKSLTP